MAEERSQKDIALEWLDYTIADWRKELKRRKIGSTNDLFSSFHGSVIGGAEGDALKIAIAYAWYGQMVDMGVGRGTKSGGQGDNTTMRRLLGKGFKHDRQSKPWYTKGKSGIAYQTKRLADLIGAATATDAVRKSFEGITLNHLIRID